MARKQTHKRAKSIKMPPRLDFDVHRKERKAKSSKSRAKLIAPIKRITLDMRFLVNGGACDAWQEALRPHLPIILSSDPEECADEVARLGVLRAWGRDGHSQLMPESACDFLRQQLLDTDTGLVYADPWSYSDDDGNSCGDCVPNAYDWGVVVSVAVYICEMVGKVS